MTINEAELRKLAMAATPGEWVQPNKKVPYVKALGADSYLLHTMPIGEDAKDFHSDTRGRWLKDAAFIAAANPATVLALLDEIAGLRTDSGLQGLIIDAKDRQIASVEAALNATQGLVDVKDAEIATLKACLLQREESLCVAKRELDASYALMGEPEAWVVKMHDGRRIGVVFSEQEAIDTAATYGNASTITPLFAPRG